MRGVFLFFLLISFNAFSQGLLRDAETEKYLHNLVNPVFSVAKLSENQTNIYLLGSKEVNAFVSGGQNIFVYAGLILTTDNEDELRGVLAHETAHIALGHLARMKQQVKMATTQAMIGMAVGAAAMAAAKDGGAEVGTALLLGSQDMVMSELLAYTRGEEEMADEMAVVYLDKLGKTSLGLKSFLDKLQKMAMFSPERNPYMLTHPTTPDRISHLQASIKKHKEIKKFSDNDEFLRIKYKLSGYILSPEEYKKLDDKSFHFKYGMIVNLMKQNKLDGAIKLCEELLKVDDEDGYIYEFLGEIYFNKSKFGESISNYEKAYDLTGSPLILADMARSQIEAKKLDEAVSNLKVAVFKDKSNLSAFKLLAVALGKQKKMGESNYYLAEFYWKAGDKKMAKQMLDKALKDLKKDSSEYIKAEDLKLEMAAAKDKK